MLRSAVHVLPCADDSLLHGIFCVESGTEHAIAVAEQRRALSFDLADVDSAAGRHTVILDPHSGGRHEEGGDQEELPFPY